MCASKRQKKLKSASLTSTSNIQLLEQWHRNYDCLSNDEREIIDRATTAARAAGGSRLAVAKHLLIVRRVLCGNFTNPKQKKLWSAYLAANLPALVLSRAQVFKDIKAWEVADRNFPSALLEKFLEGGFAWSVRPTADEPLGRYTKPCQHILAKLKPEQLDGKECEMVLAEAAALIKVEAKKNRTSKTKLTADEKREKIFAQIHGLVVEGIEELSKAIEPGESYSERHVRDDLELIVCRLMTATGIDALEVEPSSLPKDFRFLSLPGLIPSSDSDPTAEAASVIAA